MVKKGIKFLESKKSKGGQQTKPEWPIPDGYNKPLICCLCCRYPIALNEDTLDTLYETNGDYGEELDTLAIVIPMARLLRHVHYVDDDPVNQWRTKIECPHCANVISVTEGPQPLVRDRDMQKIYKYKSIGEQIVILWYMAYSIEWPQNAKTRYVNSN